PLPGRCGRSRTGVLRSIGSSVSPPRGCAGSSLLAFPCSRPGRARARRRAPPAEHFMSSRAKRGCPMPDTARDGILERLRAAPSLSPPSSDFSVMARKSWPPAERYARLRRMMEAVRAEFVETTESDWPQAVWDFVRSQGWSTLLYGAATEAGKRLRDARPAGDAARLVAYDHPIEEFKGELFEKI